MKKSILLISFLASVLHAQIGDVIITSFSGPDSHGGATGGFGSFRLPKVVTDLNTGTAFASFKMGRVEPYVQDTSLSGVDITLLTAITGSSGSTQTINIATTSGIPTPLITGGGYNVFVIDGGLPTQETIPIYTIVDSTHITTTAQLNHSIGAKLRLVFSSFTKSFDINMSGSLATIGMSNVGLLRFDPLPNGVYDQYKIISNPSVTCPVSTGSATPWYSSLGATGLGTNYFSIVPQWDVGSLTVQFRPTNQLAFETGPLTVNTDPGTCAEVQFLFTVTPEPLTTGIEYRMYWDYN